MTPKLLIPGLALLLSACGAALATDAYIGKWASTIEQCGEPQSSRAAPLILGQFGYDQNETHCKFFQVYNGPDGWKLSGKCKVEGQTQFHKFNVKVDGDKLTISEKKIAPRTLVRCKN